MGLDITHGTWHGAYSAFHRWREKIAEVAGLPPLELMEGFWQGDDHYAGPFFMVRKSIYPTGEEIGAKSFQSFINRLPIKWECLKPDPLHHLLFHSDCDGELTYGQCGKIAKRLEELLPLLPDEDNGGHIGNWRDKTQTFINGLRLAHSKKEKVKFR